MDYYACFSDCVARAEQVNAKFSPEDRRTDSAIRFWAIIETAILCDLKVKKARKILEGDIQLSLF